MAKQPRNLSADGWETAQGDTAEVGVGALPGLGALDSDASLGDKLVTQQTLRPAGVDDEIVRKHFFDLTASSRGVLASVRTGHLKKDLSLLFEKDKSDLPAPYRFDPGDVREPSIRPMSPEIAEQSRASRAPLRLMDAHAAFLPDVPAGQRCGGAGLG